jgi:hypothetical protein
LNEDDAEIFALMSVRNVCEWVRACMCVCTHTHTPGHTHVYNHVSKIRDATHISIPEKEHVALLDVHDYACMYVCM